VVIGLDFNDPPADAANQQGRADQFGRDVVNASRKESLADWA
jgi:hypothetical protein